ncbi:MAG: M1 family metallopeptidase, partial [Acidobacteria bacterium]|nr:M1 family metallopeptidase [Candidatus Sulfomarinibacter sp. MAG AM1]
MRFIHRSGWLRLALVAVALALGPVSEIDAGTVDYEIEVSLDPVAHRLQASERVRWTNSTDAPTDEIYLHLYLNAFANSDTTFMRELHGSSLRNRVAQTDSWGWMRIDRMVLDDGTDLMPGLEFVRPDDDNPADFSVARVALPRVVVPGGVVELDLEFSAQLPRIIARTGFDGDFHLVGQWFPKIGVFEGEEGWNCHQFHASSEFFADFGAYRVSITLPEDWVLGATGIEVGNAPVDGGRRTVVYRAERVHDFAWCAAPPDLMEVVETDFSPGRDVPMRWLERAQTLLGLSAAELELPPMRLRLIVPRAQRVLAPRMVRAARLSVAWFGLFYGPYPYPQVTIVSPPVGAEEAGGMEYPTFFTTGADRLDAYPPFSWSSDIETVTVHEFGHQYFQGMLASNEFERGWLDEGVNTYAELECMTAIAADGLVPEIRPFPYWGAERLALAIPRVPVKVATRAWEYRRRWIYYLASYAKTAVVLHTVEGLIGPEAMARGLRSYVDRYAFHHPSGRDLVAALSDEAEQDMGPFFEQAIWSDAVPDWAVTSVSQRLQTTAKGFSWDDGEWRVVEGADAGGADDEAADSGIWLVDVELARLGDFIGPVEVELTWAGGASERRTWGGEERWVRWNVEGPQRLAQVVVDPDGVWALETRRADNYWRDEPVRADHPLWWVREVLGLAGKI